MAESKVSEPTHEDLLREAQERLAARFGGQWAMRAAPVGTEAPAAEVQPVEIISQAQLVEAETQNIQRLQELGLLAVGSNRRDVPYFGR
ncbi:MAG TPA: hypothetical protein VK978_04150 [Candidatus Saccharimonadales bacterium]|nr:hypothetical protein [Candidatus Saccharimonadales bacterium]